MKRLLPSLIFILLFVLDGIALEREKAVSIYKEKLIIADFADKSSWKGLEKGLTDDLVALFGKTKRFDIIERDKLLAILKEQELQMSGIVNEIDAVKVGQLIGANYILFGSITSADAAHSEKNVVRKFKDKYTGETFYKKFIVTSWEGRVTISARLVEIKTGKVLITKIVTGYGYESAEREKNDKTFLDKIINVIRTKNNAEAIREYHRQMYVRVVNSARKKSAYDLVIDFLKDFPLSGYIISQTEENNYLIDLGTAKGMNSPVNLKINGKAEEIIHPVTGELTQIRTKNLGYLQVIELEPATSVAKLVKGNPEDVVPGLKVEVVEPVFIWHRTLASGLFPGLGQMLEKKWSSGIMYFLLEGAMIGGAYYSYYLSTDAYLKEQPMLDNQVWDIHGNGEQYKHARLQALAGMWVFIGLEVIIHVMDMIDAGYPAERNAVLVKTEKKDQIQFAFDNNYGKRKISLYKSFYF